MRPEPHATLRPTAALEASCRKDRRRAASRPAGRDSQAAPSRPRASRRWLEPDGSGGSTSITGAGRFLKKPERQLRDLGTSAPSASVRPERISVGADFKTARDRHDALVRQSPSTPTRAQAAVRRQPATATGSSFLDGSTGAATTGAERFRSCRGTFRHGRHGQVSWAPRLRLWNDNRSRRDGRSARSCRRTHPPRSPERAARSCRRADCRRRSIRRGHIRRRRTPRIGDCRNDEHSRGNENEPLNPRRLRSGRGRRGHRWSVARRSKHRRSNHRRSNHRRSDHREQPSAERSTVGAAATCAIGTRPVGSTDDVTGTGALFAIGCARRRTVGFARLTVDLAG